MTEQPGQDRRDDDEPQPGGTGPNEAVNHPDDEDADEEGRADAG